MEGRRSVTMRKKRRDERGETLIEAMASILIVTLAVLLLFSAVMASGNINRNARKLDREFYAVLNRAERQSETVTDNSIVPSSKVTVEETSPTPGILYKVEVPVDFYGGEGALSYSYPAAAGP